MEEGPGRLTKQVPEAVSCSDCSGQVCPGSLSCGLAMVKSALLTGHLESQPTPILEEGCGSFITGEFPL